MNVVDRLENQIRRLIHLGGCTPHSNNHATYFSAANGAPSVGGILTLRCLDFHVANHFLISLAGVDNDTSILSRRVCEKMPNMP